MNQQNAALRRLQPDATQPLAPLRAAARAPAPAPTAQHARATIALHWASALAVLLSALAALARDWTESEPARVLLLDVHRQLGLFVLLALVLRVAVRLRKGLVDHAASMPPLMRWAAQGAHLALYALLLALPLLGVATTQAHEVNLRLFGLLSLPNWVPGDPDLAETLSDWHLWLAWTLLALVVLHVAAALWHHKVQRDGVLAAMLPAVRRLPPR